MNAATATWSVAALATFGVIVRPWRLPEAVWAVAGAASLVGSGLLPAIEAWRGIVRGDDVYLFLVGMMLLAELARAEGLFDWLAAHAARAARGSAIRLFGLIYIVGILVTSFLSNDATAVVLTPAVSAATRAAKIDRPMPYLLICAFIANAASFVLPISNPANLVIYGDRMPRLAEWLRFFLLPSVCAIVVTYIFLRLNQRAALRQPAATEVAAPTLSVPGQAAAIGIALTAILLMVASWRGWELGLPTCLAGLTSCAVVLALSRRLPLGLLANVSWSVIPLVASLFVLVQAVARTGLLGNLASWLNEAADHSVAGTAAGAGAALGLLSNMMNNLPAGLIAGGTVHAAHVPHEVTGAVLIGVDLGPNLSVTGSLATILWLNALRRDGITISAGKFLCIGAWVMPPALLAALGALLLQTCLAK